MKSNLPIVVVGLAAVVLVIVGAIAAVKMQLAKDEIITIHQEAVKKGYAEYNPTNGVWHWK